MRKMEENTFKNFEEAFVAGFCDAAPAGYDAEADGETPSPWCAPWHWEDSSLWFDASMSAYEMGQSWAKKNYDELEALLNEEDQ